MATTKIHSVTATQVRTLAYITNDVKTDNSSLVYSFMCSQDPEQAEKEFSDVQRQGTGRSKVLARHIVQSFKPGEVTPEQALEIGIELCERLLKNQYQYVVAVHTDRKHIHCHIVFNNTNFENGKTFNYLEDRGSKKAWEKLREISDEICKEKGLSVVKDPEKNKGKGWYEWDKNRQGQSWKSQLKFALDECVMESENFDIFLKNVRDKGIEVSYNPEHKIDLKFRMEGQQKWSRAKTLGWYYESAQIKKRIEQFRLFKTGRALQPQRTEIIDTSGERFSNSKGLERWADIHNMQEASKVINLLTSMGISDTSQIESRAIADFGERVRIVSELNDTQRRIDELSQVIKAVRQIKKYKPVAEEYKALSGTKSKCEYAKKYAPDLDKYKSAGAYLKSVYADGKVPSEEKLAKERSELIGKRNELNSVYKAVTLRIKELDKARQTIRDYLKNEQNKNRSKDELE